MNLTLATPADTGAEPAPALSVIVAVDGAPALPETLSSFRPVLDGLDLVYDVYCVIDGRKEKLLSEMLALAEDWPQLTVIGQRPWLDDEAALQAAVRRSRGERILTLAGWPEVEATQIGQLITALDTSDMAVAIRKGRAGSWRNRLLQRALRLLFGHSVSDPFCRTRASHRAVLEETSAYGVRQHFLPVISAELGHTVREIELTPAGGGAKNEVPFIFKPLGHLRAFFDVLTLFVVMKFLRRPLRFFGAIGLPVFLLGVLVTAIYLGMRVFGGVALADRPGLIFAVLMVVLGLQIIALGLVGEIIIFANSRRMKQYTVKTVIRSDPEA